MIEHVELTDIFDQFRQKTNQVIDTVNNMGASAAAISSSSPTSGQALLFDGTSYRNVTLHGDVTITSDGHVTVSVSATGVSKGRTLFGNGIRGLY